MPTAGCTGHFVEILSTPMLDDGSPPGHAYRSIGFIIASLFEHYRCLIDIVRIIGDEDLLRPRHITSHVIDADYRTHFTLIYLSK